MDEFKYLNRIEYKIDKIQDDLNGIKEVITKNTADIAHHIKRTDLAEQALDILRADITPVKNHISFIKGALTIMGLIGGLIMALHQLGILQKLF